MDQEHGEAGQWALAWEGGRWQASSTAESPQVPSETESISSNSLAVIFRNVKVSIRRSCSSSKLMPLGKGKQVRGPGQGLRVLIKTLV